MKKIRQDSSLESISLIASIEDLNCLQFPSSKPKREKEGEKQLLFSFLVPPGFFSASVSFCLFSSRLSSPSLPLSSSLFLSLPLSLFLSYVLLLFFCWSWFLNFQFCCFLPSSQILFWLLFPSDLYITSLSFIPFIHRATFSPSSNIIPFDGITSFLREEKRDWIEKDPSSSPHLFPHPFFATLERPLLPSRCKHHSIIDTLIFFNPNQMTFQGCLW